MRAIIIFYGAIFYYTDINKRKILIYLSAIELEIILFELDIIIMMA